MSFTIKSDTLRLNFDPNSETGFAFPNCKQLVAESIYHFKLVFLVEKEEEKKVAYLHKLFKYTSKLKDKVTINSYIIVYITRI